MGIKPRIGIYGSVPRESEFFDILTHLLGYDPYLVKEVEQDKIISPVCGRAKTFGAHFTIYDIFTPTDYDAVIEKLKEIISQYSVFKFKFVGFSGYVRGDYQGKSVYSDRMKTVLALDFDDASIGIIKNIHANIVQNIQKYRSIVEPEFDKDIFRNVPELWQLIQRYGAPYVLQNFTPHLTVASKLNGSEEQCDKMITYLDKKYGDKLFNKDIIFDAIYIFEEIIDNDFGGYFRIKDVLKLPGS